MAQRRMGDGPMERYPRNWNSFKIPGVKVELSGDKWTTLFFLGVFTCLIIMGGLGYLVGWKVRDLQQENGILRGLLIADSETEDEEACDVQLRSNGETEAR